MNMNVRGVSVDIPESAPLPMEPETRKLQAGLMYRRLYKTGSPMH